MKVAIVYDRVNKWGGAERVLLALHELFPKAPLYTSVYNPKTAPWARVFRVKTSFLQYIPFANSFHELLAPLMPLAFWSFSFKKYDLVISVTSEFGKGVRVSKNTVHICYCLTPTRYLWSGYKEYFRNRYFRRIAFPVIFFLRKIDKWLAQKPDIFVAISFEVKKRIQKYYKKDSIVIYPPVKTIKFKNSNQLFLSNFFLVVSRLVPYKRIDLAVKACNKLKAPLVIIGKGIEEKRIKKIAGKTIFFVESLTDEELSGYYKNCLVLLFAGKEDFGLTIVEAQSFGKPVIAYNKGGATETVVNNKTGILFNAQTTESLIDAIKKFKKMKFNKLTIIKNANRFSEKRFKKDFKDLVLRQAQDK